VMTAEGSGDTLKTNDQIEYGWWSVNDDKSWFCSEYQLDGGGGTMDWKQGIGLAALLIWKQWS